MILEKLVPIDSSYYKKYQNLFKLIGTQLDRQGWIHLFTIWTLTVSGIVVTMDANNRFVYWMWDGWTIGLIKLAIASFIFFRILKPENLWKLGHGLLNTREIMNHIIIGFGLIIFGWINPDIFKQTNDSYSDEISSSASLFNEAISLVGVLPYLIAFASCLLIFQFTLQLDEENRRWSVADWGGKMKFLTVSVMLMGASILLGIILEDPVVSTAGAVSFPFALIALIWPNHVRHLQRARFYPLFIFAMFLSVRAPWFLIPLAILFFSIRTVNYLRFGIVYPSFGVDFLDEQEHV